MTEELQKEGLAQWERDYLQVLRDLLEKSQSQTVPRSDRTGTGVASKFGCQLRVALRPGRLPALVTKQVHLKSVFVELFWFLTGQSNIEMLRAHDVKIWDKWELNGEVGPMYGVQWRRWEGADGLRYDQIADLLINLRIDPYSRRHVVSAWNPSVLPHAGMSPQDNVAAGRAALAACHMAFQAYVDDMTVSERVYAGIRLRNAPTEALEALTGVEDAGAHHMLDKLGVPSRKLSLRVDQRSADWFLGVPFNITSYALLTHMLCKVCGYYPGELVMQFGDIHLYSNHLAQAQEQLDRAGLALQGKADIQYPHFVFNEGSMAAPNYLDNLTLDDIDVTHYKHMGRLLAEVAK